MSVLHRKLGRELKSAGGLLLAIVSIVAVGVSCYVAMGSAYNNLNEAKRRYYQQCRMADFSVELKKAPLAELAPIAELPGVVEIRPDQLMLLYTPAVGFTGTETFTYTIGDGNGGSDSANVTVDVVAVCLDAVVECDCGICAALGNHW